MSNFNSRLALALACVGILNLNASAAVKASGPSMTSRTVPYHDQDILPISTQVRFTTLIQLPRQETIADVSCGDKDYWQINWTGNVVYIKSAKVAGRTNVNVVAASGNVYSFIVSEVSQVADAHADLKVLVNPADPDAQTAMRDKPRFVLAEQAEGFKKQAEEATAQLKAEEAASSRQIEKERNDLQATYPTTIKFDYKYSVGQKNPFNVSAMFHDDKFFYIDAAPEETPAIYEVKDGKPSLIEYQFKDGRYTVPKILNEGFLRVGKSELKFKRIPS